MGVFEALVLLCIGLLAGIAATVVDVLIMGAASFVTHISLWVLVNTLVTVHVDSRVKAIWWAIPFNLGFMESYFITTAASYEGFAKSSMVPLAAMALISPLLTYAIWTARSERKRIYGRLLALLISAGTVAMGYMVNMRVSPFSIVVAVLVALIILVMPAKRLKITRSEIPASQQAEVVSALADETAGSLPVDGSNSKGLRSRLWHRTAKRESTSPATSRRRVSQEDEGRRSDGAADVASSERRGSGRSTRRRGTRRKADGTQRSARPRMRNSQEYRNVRRGSDAQTPHQDQRAVEMQYPMGNVTPLGTARTARRSTQMQNPS